MFSLVAIAFGNRGAIGIFGFDQPWAIESSESRPQIYPPLLTGVADFSVVRERTSRPGGTRVGRTGAGTQCPDPSGGSFRRNVAADNRLASEVGRD